MSDELAFWRRHPELPFALVCVIVVAILAGCAERNPAASSSVPATAAKLAAQSVAQIAGGRVCAVAPTGSMRPTFDANALLVTETVAIGSVRTGDIIVRSDGLDGRLIVHRVVRISASGVVTRGDANEDEDAGYVDDSNLKGRVVAVIYGAR